jgi:hypothetical protein
MFKVALAKKVLFCVCTRTLCARMSVYSCTCLQAYARSTCMNKNTFSSFFIRGKTLFMHVLAGVRAKHIRKTLGTH